MTDIPRKAALQVIETVSQKKYSHLDRIITDVLDDSSLQLSFRDRKFANILIFGVLRNRETLDWVIRRFSKTRFEKINPKILNILRMGVYQIFFLDRVPDSAAVNTSVELAKQAAPAWVVKYVNAVLRNAARNPDALDFENIPAIPEERIAISTSFPRWLVKRWINRFGSETCQSLCAAFNVVPPITIRCNALKIKRSDLQTMLAPHVRAIDTTVYGPEGLFFDSPEKPIQELSAFQQGFFQVQDEAAQLITHLLAPRPGENVLDACAGLGGKTGHIAQMMENRGQVIAADRDDKKLYHLRTAMAQLDLKIVTTRAHDFIEPAREFPYADFDRILLDAPCSGIGVIRRNPDTKWRVSASHLKKCAATQRRLLAAVSLLLKPGGTMVYGVCSIEPEENEQVVEDFLTTHPHFEIRREGGSLPFDPHRFISEDGYFRSFPHVHDMDGFFAVCLKRTK
jgi:16S rRNA (cytosine967-C5)-methyltransferase